MIGLEIGHSRLKAVRLDSENRVESFHQAVLDFRESLLTQVIDFINEIKKNFGAFETLGVAVSGIVDKQKNRIVLSKFFPELTATNLVEELAQNCNVKAVLENDANAAAWAEYVLGAGRGSHSIFYILLNRGVGGAAIFNGELWRGSSGFAGEIGWCLIDAEENLRLEDVASSDGILRRIRNRIHQDQTSSLARISEELITITDVVREANNGDDFTQMMLERTGAFIGITVSELINILNVERVIVGGEVMQAGEPILRGIRQSVQDFSFGPSSDATKIVAGELGEKAAAIGSALLAKVVN